MLRLLIALGLGLPGLAAAAPVEYTVRFPAPQSHYAEVTATLPGGAPFEVMLPVWTPGSYLVREYARQLEAVSARGRGGPLPVTKTRKNRWRVDPQGSPTVTLTYRVYGRELSVRTNFFDADFALISPAATFLTVAGAPPTPHDVQIELPAGWRHTATGLDPHPNGRAHHYRAQDFDELVDSPILAGDLQVDTFTVGGKPHVLATVGGHGQWDNARAAADLARLVALEQAFWGAVPYARYVFLNLLVESGGGLEHLDSTVIMASRFTQRTRKADLGWRSLAAHEFFHTWNVKRLRPVELGPFDYEAENPTRALWIAEGVTAYYDDLFVRRLGDSTDAEYLEQLSKQLEDVQTTPGRAVTSLAAASYDAWIKFYRPDENSRNVTVNYYSKGAMVAFLLDAEIRRRTKGRRSLDDVMRLAWQRHAADGYTNAQFEAAASEVAGADLGAFFDAYVRGTAELDLEPALAFFGLRLKPKPEKKPTDDPPGGWLGIHTREAGGRLLVSAVVRDGPAAAAGLNVDDELIAFGAERVPAGGLDKLLALLPAGTQTEALVARRGRLRRLPITLGEKPAPTWQIEIDPKAEKAAAERRAAWWTARK